MTKPVLFSFMSGLSDLWPPPPPWTVYSDHSCPVSHHLVLFLFEFRFVCFVSRSKVKKIRWPSLSFFLSCPAPVFRIYDLPPPWTVYSDHSCPPVSHHLVLFPFEFRFVCFVSRSKVKKFDDQACPFFVHVRLRSTVYLYCVETTELSGATLRHRLTSKTTRTYKVSMMASPLPPRQYHLICTVYARVGEGGVREGHGPWVTPARALVFLNML